MARADPERKAMQRCNLGEPSPAKSKAELMQYLHDSLTNRAIASINVSNLLEPVQGQYWGATGCRQ
jgi:hypothetical protein